MNATPSARYSAVAIALHWMIAVLVLGQLAGGFYMANLPKEQAALKFEIYQWHKSFGITILLLTAARVLWRLTHKPPPLPAAMPHWEKVAARSVHAAFYVLLIVMPLVGWAVVSSSPLAPSVQTYLFGIVYWPHLPIFDDVADRAAVSHQFAEAHETLAYVTTGLVALHVGAALKHHFINRDGVLGYMAPMVRSR
jgi:cytochrome b561